MKGLMKKRICSMVLAAIMVVTLLPVKTFAADTVTYIDANGETKSCGAYALVTDCYETTLESGTYVVKNAGVKIPGTLILKGDVQLILCDGAGLNVTGGIYQESASKLTVFGQNGQTGQLFVSGETSCDDIIINGGIINFIGGGAASIDGLDCKKLIVNAGFLETVGGAGYYSGVGISADSIVINGGSVKAVGGGGDGLSLYANSAVQCVDVTINGGIVDFVGGSSELGGHNGINPGYGNPGDLKVNGGIVSIIGSAGEKALTSSSSTGNGVTVTTSLTDKVLVSSDGVTYSTWNGSDDLLTFSALIFAYETLLPKFDLCNGGAQLKGASANSAPATTPVWGTYVFDGWYTQEVGGEKITSDFDNTKTYYAHWWTNSDKNTLVLTEGVETSDSDEIYIGMGETPATADELARYGLSYDSGELTMTNAVIDTAEGVWFYTKDYYLNYYAALNLGLNTTINLVGENFVRLGDGSGERYGINNWNGYVNLYGDKLNVECAGSQSGDAYGIYSSGDSEIDADVTATAGDATGYYSIGMQIYGGSFCLKEGAKLSAYCGKTLGEAYGFCVSTSFIKCEKGSTLTAIAGEGWTGSFGIWCNGDGNQGIVVLDDAVLTAVSGEGNRSCGVCCRDSISNCGKFTATSVDAEEGSIGVYCEKSIENVFDSQGKISEFTVSAGNSDDSFGVFSNSTIINKCLFTSLCEDYGIGCTNGLAVLDGMVTSYGRIQTGSISVADGMDVTGYDATGGEFVSGSTSVLALSGTDPIVISLPGSLAVVYDSNGAESGSVPADSNEYAFGDTATVLDNTGYLTKNGYLFDCWNTKSDGTGTSYKAGETLNINANTTLYAKWIKDITITATAASETVEEGDFFTINITVKDGNDPIQSGSVSIKENGNSSTLDLDEGAASFSSNTYPSGDYSFEIIYSQDGHDYKTTVTVKVIAPHTIHNLVKNDGQAPTETAPGWKDYYECKDIEGACGKLFEDEAGETPIENLDAWKAEGGNGYLAPVAMYDITVTGDENGTASAKINDVTVDKAEKNATVTLTATPSEGYVFDYWESSPNVEITDNKFNMPDCAIVVTAHFKVNPNPDPEPGAKPKEAYYASLIAALETNEAGVIEWKEGTALPLAAVKRLVEKPELSLEFTFTYEGEEHTILIPAGAFEQYYDEEILWYGPAWLIKYFGEPQKKVIEYIIVKGDTLNALAEKFKCTVDEILALNPYIKDRHWICSNDKLLIPVVK